MEANKAVVGEEITEKITGLVEPILRDYCIDLVDVEFHPVGKRWLLRIFIDKEGGVTISDCEHVSRELAQTLDVEDAIEHPYTLEVSSPGLTRALKKKKDFERYMGKECRIVTSLPVEGKNEFKGVIGPVTEESVEVWVDTDMYRVPFSSIKKAHLEFDL
jgi:ribosome maturation factor RimP